MSNDSPKVPDAQKSLGLIDWFIHNSVAANILMLALILGGIVSASAMRTQTFPTIDPRLVTVSVVYPGATPYEVAEGVTNRIEEAIKGIEGVERTYAVAREGNGIVNVELTDFADASDVFNDVETAVGSLQQFPPEDAERPIVNKVKVTPKAMSLALHGEVDEKTLKFWSDKLEEELRRLSGVASTSVTGVRDYQISVEVSEQNLRKYNLNFDQIASAIRNFSSDIPAGTLESEAGEILLRVQDRRYTGAEFETIALTSNTDGSALYLRDVAKVIDGFTDENAAARFNGQPAAFINVYRGESNDTLVVAKTLETYLDTVQLPSGLTLTVQEDETSLLRARISLMLRNGIIGFTMVFLILSVFLDLRLAFWTSAAIPISFLGGLMLMQTFGYTINMVSLFALIVVLGIVVDDGIVTGESIYQAHKNHPNDPDATRRGVREVIAPVTVGVATTMAAFAPLLFSTGQLGQIVSVIPAAVISILFISLIEAYFILPSHLSHTGTWSRGLMADIRDKVDAQLYRFVENHLEPAIKFSLRWRYATIALFISIAIVVAGFVTSGVVRFIFFPQVEGNRIEINMEVPVGSTFQVTESTLTAIEQSILGLRDELEQKSGLPIFESISVIAGQQSGGGSPMSLSSSSTESNIGQVTVQLVPSDFRSLTSSEIEKRIRARIENLPNLHHLEFVSSLLGQDADINIELSDSNETELLAATDILTSEISAIRGAIDVRDTFELGKKEFVFRLNEQGIAVGLTPMILGQQLRSVYFGLEAMRYQRGRSEMVVYVRYPKADRESVSMLADTRIRLADGTQVPLKSVADIVEQNGYSSIESVDGRRIVSVLANANTDIVTPTELISRIETHILPNLTKQYPNLEFSFEGESRDQRQDLASLSRNMILAGMMIYVLLSAQLRSYAQPLLIMSAIPFGAAGAVLGHFLMGYDLTFISLFGMVALTGVVVNDSVVLVDYLNTHQRTGVSVIESTVIAVKRRFRPILLTTLSTCMGLLPMLLETSPQAQFLIPMVISLSTGLLFSTFVILFFVPCLVCIGDDVKGLDPDKIRSFLALALSKR